MLLLLEALLEAVLKSKTEHIIETDGLLTHMLNIYQNVHSHHRGGHSTSHKKKKKLATKFTGMTSFRQKVLEDLGSLLEVGCIYTILTSHQHDRSHILRNRPVMVGFNS